MQYQQISQLIGTSEKFIIFCYCLLIKSRSWLEVSRYIVNIELTIMLGL